MTTVDDRPAADTTNGLRLAAMKALAKGKTAADVARAAADPNLLAALAMARGETEEDVRDFLLAISVAVGVITREGMTPEQCAFLLRLTGEAPAPVLSLVPCGA